MKRSVFDEVYHQMMLCFLQELERCLTKLFNAFNSQFGWQLKYTKLVANCEKEKENEEVKNWKICIKIV